MDRENFDNFDKLVGSMPIEERQSLLNKLKAESTISTEHLYLPDIAPDMDTRAEYTKLPWYLRLWYSILGIFKTKSPEKLYADSQIAILGSKINERYPGIYDFQKKLLLSPFLRQMEKLKDAARFFYLALDVSVNKDRGAFFAFIGSLEMADIHRRLNEDTDPAILAERNPQASETELRQIAVKSMEEALKQLPDESRALMYKHSRSLFCLKELSTFLYDRVIMAFSNNKVVNEEACFVNNIKELLSTLNNILVSLKTVPSIPILQSLFIFMLHEKAEESEFDMNSEIASLLKKAEASLGIIRDFNNQIPLIHIIRCASRNMSFLPQEISGGEDWFAFYRDYWKKRLEALFADYLKGSRERQLLELFENFFKGKEIKSLQNTYSDSNPEGFPINREFALSFLLSFYSLVFIPEINMILHSILIDGEFEKKENRIEFTEAYNNILKLDEEIQKIDREISVSGDYGKRYIQVRQEMTALTIKRRKTQIVLDEVQELIDNIIEKAMEASQSIVYILNGILGLDIEGKYTVLVNLAKFTKSDERFVRSLNETLDYFKNVIHTMDEIEHIESGQ